MFHFLRYLLIPAKNHVVTDFGAKAATVMRVLTVSADMVEKLQNLLSQVLASCESVTACECSCDSLLVCNESFVAQIVCYDYERLRFVLDTLNDVTLLTSRVTSSIVVVQIDCYDYERLRFVLDTLNDVILLTSRVTSSVVNLRRSTATTMSDCASCSIRSMTSHC